MAKQEADNLTEPPVFEMSMAIQFDTISAPFPVLAGLYWDSVLKEEWPIVTNLEPMRVEFDIIDGESQENIKRIVDALGSSGTKNNPANVRTAFGSEFEDKILHVQPTRFIFTWRKNRPESLYPGFVNLNEQFLSAYSDFENFFNGIGLSIDKNLWDMEYANFFSHRSGESQASCASKVQGIELPEIDGLDAHSFGFEYRYDLERVKGRVTVKAQPGEFNEEKGLIFRIRTRGMLPCSADINDVASLMSEGNYASNALLSKLLKR